MFEPMKYCQSCYRPLNTDGSCIYCNAVEPDCENCKELEKLRAENDALAHGYKLSLEQYDRFLENKLVCQHCNFSFCSANAVQVNGYVYCSEECAVPHRQQEGKMIDVEATSKETKKRFTICIDASFDLDIDEIWPDGDAPENPTAADVVKLIEQCGNISNFINEWNLETAFSVSVG